MSKRLDNFIHDNREEFDDLEPSPGLWEGIESKLDLGVDGAKKREAKTFSLGFVLRVAATIIVVMGVGFGIYLKTQSKTANVNLAAINPEYAKQQVHYASLVKEKRNELKEVAKIDPQLYKEFNGEIAKMDSSYKKLTSQLKTSPNQERVLRAMIRNLQIQTEVLNQQLQVIQQFSDYKNQNDNGSKNI
ncbi:hypothetical protein [Mucilaginibacter ginkgonis]|uniref:Uncharacterized protein n=1 Tax=Mucilaginibacter ginkgonis TaxID=2682091 RepID=A0A6I4HZ30_9SPHI|nr:hypothetical protein [Mucilaginibacter ginkgonis]QQL49725.1 hypothetical protein GO620_016385 [Mucilaginibacter ginkgonis]